MRRPQSGAGPATSGLIPLDALQSASLTTLGPRVGRWKNWRSLVRFVPAKLRAFLGEPRGSKRAAKAQEWTWKMPHFSCSAPLRRRASSRASKASPLPNPSAPNGPTKRCAPAVRAASMPAGSLTPPGLLASASRRCLHRRPRSRRPLARLSLHGTTSDPPGSPVAAPRRQTRQVAEADLEGRGKSRRLRAPRPHRPPRGSRSQALHAPTALLRDSRKATPSARSHRPDSARPRERRRTGCAQTAREQQALVLPRTLDDVFETCLADGHHDDGARCAVA